MPGALVLDTEFNTRPFRLLSAGFVRLDKHARVRATQGFLIRPDGFVLDDQSPAFRVHGISHAHATKHGQPMQDLLHWLQQTLPCTSTLVGHNVARDLQLLKEEALRSGCVVIARLLSKVRVVDTMVLAKEAGLSPLSLGAVHSQLFGGSSDLPSAHDALADAQYTASIYAELLARRGTARQATIKAFLHLT
jgi:DNA polymerase III epsilon subunit-like protein